MIAPVMPSSCPPRALRSRQCRGPPWADLAIGPTAPGVLVALTPIRWRTFRLSVGPTGMRVATVISHPGRDCTWRGRHRRGVRSRRRGGLPRIWSAIIAILDMSVATPTPEQFGRTIGSFHDQQPAR